MLIILIASEEVQQQLIALIDTHQKALYSFAFRLTMNKHDADDLFQQTWLNAVKRFSFYEEKNAKAWLFKICLNQYKDNFRRNRQSQRIIQDRFVSTEQKNEVINSAKSTENPQLEVEKKAIRGLIFEKINGLPKKKREPIIMFYYQAMKYDEIAEILNVPVGTVRSRIFDAKRLLKQQIEGEIYV